MRAIIFSFQKDLTENSIFKYDNARQYRAQRTREAIETENITRLDWIEQTRFRYKYVEVVQE